MGKLNCAGVKSKFDRVGLGHCSKPDIIIFVVQYVLKTIRDLDSFISKLKLKTILDFVLSLRKTRMIDSMLFLLDFNCFRISLSSNASAFLG